MKYCASKTSEQQILEDFRILIYLRQACRVNLQAHSAKAVRIRMADGSGRKLWTPFGNASHSGLSSKIHPELELLMAGVNLRTSSLPLPASGIVYGGTLSPLPPLVQSISAKGSGFLPTPTASSGGQNGTAPQVKKGKHGINLKGKIGGIPHPEFVEQLMGFPTLWTDLER